MSLSLAIALNVAVDVLIVGMLSFVMSRARRLQPHAETAVAPAPAVRLRPAAHRRPARRPTAVPAAQVWS